jgi:hypothetical protein
LGLLAKQLETIVDALTSVAPTEKPIVTRTPLSVSVDIKPPFKRLKSKELDQLGFDVAALRQLTHDDLVAKQAIADAKATNMATSACYITTCLYAEKVAQTLEHATISFNLRQGQANSPAITDFATEVVHDPTDCTFLGGVYTMGCTHEMHGVGIRGKSRYMHTQSPSDPPPSSALDPPSGPFLVNPSPRNPVVRKFIPPPPPKSVLQPQTQYGPPIPISKGFVSMPYYAPKPLGKGKTGNIHPCTKCKEYGHHHRSCGQILDTAK